MRSKYIEKLSFLSPDYNSSEIFIQSTNVNRTIISAYSQLMGLYPHGNGPEIPEGINKNLLFPPIEINYANLNSSVNDSISDENEENNEKNDSFEMDNDLFTYELENKKEALPNKFQPIPVHTKEIEKEYLLRAWDRKTCPVNLKWQEEQYNTLFFKKLNQDFIHTKAYISNLTGVPIENVTLVLVQQVFDTFNTFIWNNKENELPSDFKDEIKKNMTFINDIIYYLLDFGSTKQKQFLNGPLFNEIATLFERKLNHTIDKKFILFSTHDMTIMQVLTGLNLTGYECIYEKWMTQNEKENCLNFPPYASNIFFELHENEKTKKFFVDVIYNSKLVKKYDYQEFLILFKSYFNKNFEKICKNELVELSNPINNDFNSENIAESSSSWGLFFGGIFLGAIIGIVGSYLFRKKMKTNDRGEILQEMQILP